MKKKVFIYFVLIITIVNLSSLGVILFQRARMSSLPYLVKGQNVFQQVKREVNLTPGQLEQFQKLRITFHAKMDSLSTNVGQKNVLLATEIKKNNPDSAFINQLVREISTMQTESQYIVIHHFYSIKKILTKEQQNKFFIIVLQNFERKNKWAVPACIPQKEISNK